MSTLPNIHPGEILKEEFLDPMNITAYRLSMETGLTQTRISQIIHGKRSITAETALIFSLFFGTSPDFWLNLQNHFDLEEIKMNKPELQKTISRYKIRKGRNLAQGRKIQSRKTTEKKSDKKTT